MLRAFRFVVALAFVCAFTCTAQAALVGLWRFDDGTANDSSGMGNHGTFQNGATTSAVTWPPTIGVNVRSLQLNGVNQHVLVPDSNSLDITGPMSISAWVRPVDTGFNGVLAKNPSTGSSINHAGNYELRLESGANQRPTFLYQQGGVDDTTAVNAGGTVVVPQNAWSHVVITHNDANFTFYVDGTAVNAGALSGLFGFANNNPLYLGSRADLFTSFNGFLDDIAIYNQSLTQSQVNSLRFGDFAAVAPEPGAIAVWTLIGLAGAAFAVRQRRRARA